MKRVLLKTLLSLAIGASFVLLACRDIDWGQLQGALARVSHWHLAVYFLILSAIQVVRTLRWGLLLRPLGPIPVGRLFSSAAIGFAALMALPLRLGELARPMLIAERGRIRISAALASVVVERVIDSLLMAALLVVMLLVLGHRGGDESLGQWAVGVAVLFLLLLGVLVYFLCRREKSIGLVRRLVRPISARLAERLASMTDAFIDGLKVLPDWRLLTAFLLATLLYWVMTLAGMVYMFGAVPGLERLGWLEGTTVLAVLCVGLMIPAGPGMIGNFHYFVKLGLGLFLGAELGPAAMAYAVVVHALQLGQQLLWGLAFLPFRRLALPATRPESDAS